MKKETFRQAHFRDCVYFHAALLLSVLTRLSPLQRWPFIAEAIGSLEKSLQVTSLWFVEERHKLFSYKDPWFSLYLSSPVLSLVS